MGRVTDPETKFEMSPSYSRRCPANFTAMVPRWRLDGAIAVDEAFRHGNVDRSEDRVIIQYAR